MIKKLRGAVNGTSPDCVSVGARHFEPVELSDKT